jgi:hypothetical protein
LDGEILTVRDEPGNLRMWELRIRISVDSIDWRSLEQKGYASADLWWLSAEQVGYASDPDVWLVKAHSLLGVAASYYWYVVPPEVAARLLSADDQDLPDVLVAALDRPKPPADAQRQPTPPGPRRRRGSTGSPTRRKPGRPSDTDKESDCRIHDAWQTKRYDSLEALAGAFGTTRREVKLALDRHRQRMRAGKTPP